MLQDTTYSVRAYATKLSAADKRGPQGRAALLRADARLALERLAETAQHVSRRHPVDSVDLGAALRAAMKRLDVYCDLLHRELTPLVAERGPFGAVLASYLRHFEQRQRCETHQLMQQLERAPRSAGVAHGVYVTAIMLTADLDAHGRDVALVMRSPESGEISIDAAE